MVARNPRLKRGKAIVVIGPGRMGLGITLAFALAGSSVTVVDAKERTAGEYERIIAQAQRELASNVRLLKRLGRVKGRPADILRAIRFRSGISKENLVGDCIFEAVPEKPELKIDLFSRISPYIGKSTPIASTTSTIDIATMSQGLSHPEMLVITHWLNPAFIIPLVEIAHSSMTSPQAVRRIRGLLKDIGKVPVVLKDSPGFIIPRIQAGAMNEAVRILEEGIATAEEIDTAIRFGFGFRLSVFGLLEFIDLGGLDILFYADRFLYDVYKSDRFKAPLLVEEKMAKGETGPRTGKGIYDYKGRNVRAIFEKKYRALIEVLTAMNKPTNRK